MRTDPRTAMAALLLLTPMTATAGPPRSTKSLKFECRQTDLSRIEAGLDGHIRIRGVMAVDPSPGDRGGSSVVMKGDLDVDADVRIAKIMEVNLNQVVSVSGTLANSADGTGTKEFVTVSDVALAEGGLLRLLKFRITLGKSPSGSFALSIAHVSGIELEPLNCSVERK